MARLADCRLVSAGLLAAGAIIVNACAPGTPRLPGSTPTAIPARLRVQVDGRPIAVALEQYVLGAALSEVTPVGESSRAAATIYEVQAIIARSYAAAHAGRHASEGFDLCDKTHCQLYEPGRIHTSRFADTARRAVVATTGRILRYGGRPAVTAFHSDCGGRTTTPAEAWGGTALPYLPGRADELPNGTHRSWQFAATVAEWVSMLRRDARTDPGGPLETLTVTKIDSSGRAAQVEISGHQTRRVSGSVLRDVVSAARGPRSLLSTRFTVTRTPTGFRVEGTGFGHGVGLCQVGAIARARRGDSVEEILAHYYPGAK